MAVPFPNLWASAQDMAAQQLGAQIGATRRSSRRETRSGRRFIRQLAHSFADELAAISGGVGRTYNMAERESAAVNAALSNYLTGSGEALSADLGEQLSYAGPDAIQAFAGGAARQGQALGRTAGAFGTQQLNRVVGEEASERAFGQSLPGIAALSGIQSARQYEGQQARALQAQIDQLHSQQPGLAAQLYQAFAEQRLQQQQMAQQERFHAEEMAAQRRALAAEAAGVKGQGRERFDRVSQGAIEFMAGFIPPPIPGQPPQDPNYAEAIGGLENYWRKFYPGKSAQWISTQARRTVESYGVTQPDRRPGAAEAGGGGMGGAGVGAVGGAAGRSFARRPTSDAVFYSSPAELMMATSRAKLGASPNRLSWEGPGYYRLSGGRIVKVG